MLYVELVPGSETDSEGKVENCEMRGVLFETVLICSTSDFKSPSKLMEGVCPLEIGEEKRMIGELSDICLTGSLMFLFLSSRPDIAFNSFLENMQNFNRQTLKKHGKTHRETSETPDMDVPCEIENTCFPP